MKTDSVEQQQKLLLQNEFVKSEKVKNDGVNAHTLATGTTNYRWMAEYN